jgi:hypothetical protein
VSILANAPFRGVRPTRARYLGLCTLLLVVGGIGCAKPAGRIDSQRPFTIAMLPDTQRYSEKRPDLFFAQTNWIKQNRDEENIVFVTHVGDLVQNRSKQPAEWKVADEAMAVLDGVVPYGVTIGNHDYDSDDGVKKGVATIYLQHFNPDKRFKGRPGYGGASPNGLNSYHLFSGGGVDFVILHLEVDAPDEALAWAKAVLEQHPTRAAIVTIHTYMDHGGDKERATKREYRKDGNSGQEIWDKFIRCNPQVFMLLCGHVGGLVEYYQISKNDAKANVLEMLADYQGRENGGDGWLRLIKFVPATREIQIRTYSPALDRFETDEGSQFTIPWEIPKKCWGASPSGGVARATGWSSAASAY